MKEKHERYRVKPGLSLTSKDIYRRWRNNSLNLGSPTNNYTLDTEIQEFTRMDKLQQMQNMKENFEKIQKLSK